MPKCLKVSSVVTNAGNSLIIDDANRNQKAWPVILDSVTADLSACDVVGISGAEYAALKAGSGNSGTVQTPTPQNWLELGNMSMADAQLISGYVAFLWAGMWGAKQIIRALFINERNQDE